MIAIPVVHLRDARFVRHSNGASSTGGVRAAESASEVARRFAELGFTRLHLADDDAAASQTPALEEIVRHTDATVQVAGGRSGSAIDELFRSGADYVVAGSRAIEEPDWLAGLATLYPDTILAATDIRDRRVVMRGWVRTLPVDVHDLVDDLNTLPLAGLVIGGLHLDGPSRAADLALVADLAERSNVPLLVSARVTALDDLRALEHRGAAGAVLGAELLLNGVLDARVVASEFGA